MRRKLGIPLVVATFIGATDASVIFPLDHNEQQSSRSRHSQSRSQEIARRQRVSFQQRRYPCPPRTNPVLSTGTTCSWPLAFTPLQAGKFLSVAALIGYIGKKLQSESVTRALYFWIHAGPVVMHYKFTRWYLTKTKAPLEKRDSVYNSLHDKYCGKCLDIALQLKGLYVKIAQIVSSRPDFVPPQYIELFTSVQDSIPQAPIDEVVQIIDKNLRSEFGQGFDEAFESIDPVALGSASIGQVHRARLRRNTNSQRNSEWLHGDDVAVKVMHTGAEDRFHHDFQVFRWLCKVALSGWEPILDECYRQIMTEFDYRQEANSLELVRHHTMNSPAFKNRVKVPQPLTELCTKEVLIMEMLHGKKLSEMVEHDLANALGGDDAYASEVIKRKRLELILGKEKMERLGYSSKNSLDEMLGGIGLRGKVRLLQLYRRAQKYVNLLVDVQGYQMFSLGVFNGDPHPGNLLVLNDGKLGLIDFGQTKRITDEERLGVARVVAAIGYSHADDLIAESMRQLGFRTKWNKNDALAKYASLFFDSDVQGKLLGCATPQMYFSLLTKMDPLVHVPDVAIFVARSSFIIRGMGTILGKQIRTATRWKEQATGALNRVN